MPDPLSLIAIGAAVGGAAGKFTEKAWDVGEKWLSRFFRDHAPAAKDAALVNAATFLAELGQRIGFLEDAQRVNRSSIEKAQDNPQFSVILQHAVIAASQTGDAEKRGILAQLVAERLTVAPESAFALAIRLACDAVASLNSTHIRLLALVVVLHEIRPRSPLPSCDYAKWLELRIGPVLAPYIDESIDFREMDILHLAALGCVTYDRASNRALDCVLMMKNGLVDGEFAFDFQLFKASDLGFYLDHMWGEGLAGVSATSIGSVVGGIALDRICGIQVGPPRWARNDAP